MMEIKQEVVWKGGRFNLQDRITKSNIYRKDYMGIGPAMWRGILRVALYEMGKMWHKTFLKKHFTASGAAEYDYKPRTLKYLKYKEKKKGHRDPLKWTGELAHSAQRTREIWINNNATVMKVKLNVPKYAYQRNGAAPDKVAELTFVSKGEVMRLARYADKIIDKMARQVGTFRSVTRGLTG